MSRREDDRAARRAAQEVFDRPLVLEAGAGTGKTATLVARILAWSTGAGWEEAVASLEDDASDGRIAARVQRGIVAITFTDAAAAELEDRIGRALLTLTRGEDPPGVERSLLAEEAATRAAALHDEISRLQVSTIHSFCHRLLAEHPLEAGLPPRWTLDPTGEQTAGVVHEVLEEGLPEAYGRLDDDLLRLAGEGIGPSRLEEALCQLATQDVPASLLDAPSWSPQGASLLLDRIRAALTRTVASGIAGFAEAGRSKTSLETWSALCRTAERLEVVDLATISLESLQAEIVELWPKTLRNRLTAWAQGDWNVTETKLLGEAEEEATRAAARLTGPFLHLLGARPELSEAARRILRPWHIRARERLRERGIVSFAGLLGKAVALLRDQGRILARRRRETRQLLVDEFQDTDRRQIELVRLLALEGPSEQRPGLALVGDPKQSIYGWRNADLEAYDGFVKEILAAGGVRHALTMNFRSPPAILEEVTRSVAPIMRPEPGLQPPYQELEAAPKRRNDKGFESPGHRPVEIWAAWDPRQDSPPRAGEAVEWEATALADDLLRLHQKEGVGFGKVGVLLRATGDLDRFLDALRRAGIPYVVERDRNYYRRREVIDAAALVRTVLDPTDHVALLACLRSSWVGLPDAALIPLWERGFPGAMTELTGPDDPVLPSLRQRIREAAATLDPQGPGSRDLPRWPQALDLAVRVVARLRESCHRDSAEVFVRRMRRLTAFEAGETGRHLGDYRAANLGRFFRRLQRELDDPGQDRQRILRRLRRAVAENLEEEDAPPPGDDRDAVRVMTIHRAKGLDFDHVYVVQMGKGRGGGSRGETEVDVSGEYRLFGWPTPGFYRVLEKRQAVSDAEAVRTLYVALTRARERLVMSGVWPRSTRQASSHLGLLAPHRLPAPIPELLTPDGAPHDDELGVRWRFLTAASEPPTPRRTTSPWAADIVAGRVEEDARVLAAGREVAASRQRCPALAAASRHPHPIFEGRSEGLGRDIATLSGELVHRVFETLDLDAPLPTQLLAEADRADRLEGLPEALAAETRVRVATLLRLTAKGPLGERLASLAPRVLGREVPFLLLPDAGDGEPWGAEVGKIDLLYRDPAEGGLVVVDFKTDSVDSDEEIDARVASYRPQLSRYLRALKRASDGGPEPRGELWLLAPQRFFALGV